MPITEESLPFLHPKVDLADLHPNRKLLSENDIAMLRMILKDFPDDRYRKKDARIVDKFPDFKSKYGIIKFGDEIFAVYKGFKHCKDIYNDLSKKVKLSQELTSGNWYVLKVESNPRNINAVTNEVLYINSYGSAKLHTKGHVLQRVSTIPDAKHPQILISKVTHSFLIPLIPGLSLLDFLKAGYKLSTYRWLEIALKMLHELRNFHHNQLLHRDIKIQNIIYNYFNHEVTIIDLEYTRRMNVMRQYLGTLTGTILYLAPEILQHHNAACGAKWVDYIYDEYTEAYALGTALKILFSIPVRMVPSAKQKLEDMEFYSVGSEKEIKDIKLIHELLDKLTSVNRQDRNLLLDSSNKVLFDGIIDYLAPIQKNILKDTLIKTAVLEIHEILIFLQHAVPVHKERFLSALQRFDEICLVNFSSDENDCYFDLIKLQRILTSTPIKIPFYKNILQAPNLKSLVDIVSLVNDNNENQSNGEEKSHSINNGPRRAFTYFDTITKSISPTHRMLINHGITIIIADEQKSNRIYFQNISDSLEQVSGKDYIFVSRAIEMECQRLSQKYCLNEYRAKLKAATVNQAIMLNKKAAFADQRYDMLKNILDNIVKLSNITLTYAALSSLLTLIKEEIQFKTVPSQFFPAKKSACIVNVEKILEELECRRTQVRQV